MHVGDKVSHGAISEAYCLLNAFLREEKIAADYDFERLKEAIVFLADILKCPDNFKNEKRDDDTAGANSD